MMNSIIFRLRRSVLVAVIVLAVVGVAQALAGGNIDTIRKWAWSSNAGWINFNPAGYGGVTVYTDHLEGYAWAENIGWIHLGSYSGGGAHTYGNTSNLDYGVNRNSVTGQLSGFAWSTNAGWIEFDPSPGGVTTDPATGDFDGYAWSENVGWIHFKNSSPAAYDVVALFHQLYLPLTMSNYGPLSGISGKVTLNGTPVGGVSLELRLVRGSTQSTLATATTDSQGNYSFTGAPGLSAGKAYYVRYVNPASAANYNHRLAVWFTRSLTAYSAGSSVSMGSFDIADIGLVSPVPGATVALPATFQWTRRSNSTADSYEFNLYDPVNTATDWWTDPSLGYVSSYQLSTLPSGFGLSTTYLWYMGVYSPDGGYGESFWSNYVIFQGGSPGILEAPEQMPSTPWFTHDRPAHRVVSVTGQGETK